MEAVKTVKFQLLPFTIGQKEILQKMCDNFTLIYNTTTVRLPSFYNIEQNRARKGLEKLRQELLGVTILHSKIAEESIEYARSNYQTMLTLTIDKKRSIERRIYRLEKEKEKSKKQKTINRFEQKIQKLKIKLSKKIPIPKLKSSIIRIHNKHWSFKKIDGLTYVVIPSEKIGKRYKPLWLPIKQSEYYDKIISNNKKFGVGQINLKDNTFITTIKIPTKPTNYEPETFVGIDLGINNLSVLVATDKDGNIVSSRFWNGIENRHIRNKFNEHRKELQKKGRKDLLIKSKGREQKWMEIINHTISKQIIDISKTLKNPIIKLEELNNFSPKLKWNFYQLRQMIEYKAKMNGIKIITINPSYTSQTCPKCNNISKGNRKGIHFKCTECGYQNNTDFVGAWNISRKSNINDNKRDVK